MKKIYTYEKCKELLQNFNSINQLKHENNSLLVVIRRNGWTELLDNLERKIHKKYTLEECINEVSKYEYLSDFAKENQSMITVIYNNKWKFILKNLKHKGNKYKRCIYAYEFNINSIKYAYIGLTFNLDARDFKHRTDKKSTVYKFANDNNIIIPKPLKLTDYIDKEEASKLESEYLNLYKLKGFITLNRQKTGNLGGNQNNEIYDKINCLNIAKKYKTITEFAKNNSRAYKLIKINKWEEDAFSHMKKYNPSLDNKLTKTVEQYSLNGEKIGEYESLSIAGKTLNIRREHISHCCNGKRKTCGGFIWKFKK